MNRVDAYIGSLQSPLKQTPEVFRTVHVDSTTNELHGVINRLVVVGIAQADIGFESIRVEMRTGLHAGADLHANANDKLLRYG
jgi:hypothetical protein